jgi:ATP/maltotriose-dependent transcriptional regulator MalT
LALAFYARGMNAWGLGDNDRAESLLTEALAYYRRVGDTDREAEIVGQLGIVAYCRGELGRSVALLEEALAGDRRAGDAFNTALALSTLGVVHVERGEFSQAATRLAESLDLNWTAGIRVQLTWCFSFVAMLAAQCQRPAAAARLFGAEAALRAVVGVPVPATERARYEAGVALARDALEAEAFAAAWSAGEALLLAEAFEEARALATELANAASALAPRSAIPKLLTRREGEVLRLIAEGMTDHEIAAALSISPRTVGHHVASILAKLGVETRRGARAYARQHSLA